MGGRGSSSGRNSNGGVVNGRRNGVKVGMNLDWFGSGKEVVSKKQKQFDAFRFQGMDVERESKKYYKIGAISEDGNKLLVSVGEDHLMKTQYGYSFAVSENKVVYLKDWQVQNSYRGGNLVLFDKKYFKPKETKYSNSSLEGAKETTFKDLTKAAKAQKNHLWQIKTKRY